MSEFKCTVEKNAVPMSRLIGKGKLNQLMNQFNSNSSTKTVKQNLNRLDKLASNKQKQSQKIAEEQKAKAIAKKKK